MAAAPAAAEASKTEWPATRDAYVLTELAGCSTHSSSSVWLAQVADRKVAIRVVDLEKQNSLNLSRLQDEVQRMGQLQHPNLAQLYTAFVARGEVWLVMQLHSAGSCATLMADAYPLGFEENIVLAILREVLRGLAYLHKHGVIHRHLKCSNILIDSQGSVRLTDFGIAGLLVEHGERRQQRQTFVGSPCWMAPEVLEQSRGYDASVDIWSTGITAIELATGSPPFAGEPPMKVLLKVLQGAPPTLLTGSKQMRELVASCLKKRPEERPKAAKLLQLRVLKDLKDGACERLLQPIVSQLEPLAVRHRKRLANATDNPSIPSVPSSRRVPGASFIAGKSDAGWNFDEDDAVEGFEHNEAPALESELEGHPAAAPTEEESVQRPSSRGTEAAADGSAAVEGFEAFVTPNEADADAALDASRGSDRDSELHEAGASASAVASAATADGSGGNSSVDTVSPIEVTSRFESASGSEAGADSVGAAERRGGASPVPPPLRVDVGSPAVGPLLPLEFDAGSASGEHPGGVPSCTEARFVDLALHEGGLPAGSALSSEPDSREGSVRQRRGGEESDWDEGMSERGGDERRRKGKGRFKVKAKDGEVAERHASGSVQLAEEELQALWNKVLSLQELQLLLSLPEDMREAANREARQRMEATLDALLSARERLAQQNDSLRQHNQILRECTELLREEDCVRDPLETPREQARDCPR